MLTNEYKSWVSALKKRYRATQIKAAVAVNSAMLEFYWSLGADISRIYPGKKRNLNFFENLSNDLCLGIDNPKGLSVANIRYAFRFYELYSRLSQVAVNADYLQRVVEDNNTAGYLQRVVEDKTPGEHGSYANDAPLPEIVKVPWGHHTVILGKCKGDQNKALFYVRKTICDAAALYGRRVCGRSTGGGGVLGRRRRKHQLKEGGRRHGIQRTDRGAQERSSVC